MPETPPNVFTGDTDAWEILLRLLANDEDLYSKIAPDAARSTYADLALRLVALEYLVQAAGSGTALVQSGTDAQRLAQSPDIDGLIWVVTDVNPRRFYIYSTSAGAWQRCYYLQSEVDSALVALKADIQTWFYMRPRLVNEYLTDEQIGAENDPRLGVIKFSNDGAWVWSQFEAWIDSVNWRIKLEAMMSTAQAADITLNIAYQVFGPDDTVNIVKQRRKNDAPYEVGDCVIPDPPNGYFYDYTVAGDSDSSPPVYPTVIGQTVIDGTATLRCKGPGMKHLTATVTPPNAAHDRFDVDTANLQIPAGEVNSGDRIHWGLWRPGDDPHDGEILFIDAWIVPVEV
jgi:hypothetical protein